MGARNLSHWHIDDKAFAEDALAGATLTEIMIKDPGENLPRFPRGVRDRILYAVGRDLSADPVFDRGSAQAGPVVNRFTYYSIVPGLNNFSRQYRSFVLPEGQLQEDDVFVLYRDHQLTSKRVQIEGQAWPIGGVKSKEIG